MEISGHDGHSLGVDGAQVGVLEKGNEVSLSGFLQSQNSGGLESELLFPFVGDFSDHSLEGELSDQKIGGLLILSDFSQSNGSGFKSVGLLHAGGDGGGFSGDLLGDQLFSGHLLGS